MTEENDTYMQVKKSSPLLPVFITVFIDMLGIGIMIPVFAPLIIRNQHGLLDAAANEQTRNIIYGLLAAIFPLFQFFGAPILGALADKYGRKKILLISLIGTFVGYLLFAYSIQAKWLWLLFVARAIPGFTGGNISIVLASLADISAPKDRAKNFGLVGMAFGLGFIFGPVIGGLLADSKVCSWFDFSTPLWFTAFLTLINIFFVIQRFPETYQPTSAKQLSLLAGIKNLKKAFQLTNLRVVLLSLFLLAFGFSFFTQFFSVFVIKKFDFDQRQIGLIFGFVGIWIAITQGLLTRIASKHFSSPQILRVSLLVFAAGLFGLILPDTVAVMYVFNAIIAIGQGLSQPNFASIVSSIADKDTQGEMLGVQQSVQSVALIIPPLVAGFIVNIDYRLPILVSSFCLLLSWLVFFFFFKEKSNEESTRLP